MSKCFLILFVQHDFTEFIKIIFLPLLKYYFSTWRKEIMFKFRMHIDYSLLSKVLVNNGDPSIIINSNNFPYYSQKCTSLTYFT